MAAPVNASIIEHGQTLQDPRIERTKTHNLLDILVLAVCTLLTGGEGFQDMELFGKSKRAWLQPFRTLPHGIPSHDTFGRVFARLNPCRLQACFLSWTQAVAQLPHGALVSLDGQTVKAAFDRATAASPLPMLSAWCSDHGGLVIGPIKTDSKSNEITALPDLFQLVALKGCIVTIDAMGCQMASAGQIRAQGRDYLLALKSNHKKAYAAVNPYFHQHIAQQLAWRTPETSFAAFADSHGRPVRRRGWSITDLTALPERGKWPDLQSVIVVETIRAAYQGAAVTSDYRIYMARLRRSATVFVTRIRQPWDIENKLQWAWDVTFNKDHCRIRKDHAAENLVALRHMTLNLLRQEHSHRLSLRQKRLRCSLDEPYLLTVLSRATADAIALGTGWQHPPGHGGAAQYSDWAHALGRLYQQGGSLPPCRRAA
jgi:predicted transposase YbfD/YdcC